jgi:hypothetical protein
LLFFSNIDHKEKGLFKFFAYFQILKLYAWEMAFGKKILDIRNEELAIIKKQRVFGLIGALCWGLAPIMVHNYFNIFPYYLLG